ncbi:YobI family P-loop NTPase [Eisenbergiella sp.]
MRTIMDKMKDILSLKRKKEKANIDYTDLAPIDEITNGEEYLNALDWALNNERIKNIALAGPYGAGKSSIIETYLKRHRLKRKKSLRISMATFVENSVNKDGTQHKIDIGKDEVEQGILKQLFYKVNYKKIPQSRYRKLHKIGCKRIFCYLVVVIIISIVVIYIFLPDIFISLIGKIVTAGASINLTAVTSLILFGSMFLCFLVMVVILYRSILSHFKVKEFKLPVDTTVKNENDSTESVFNKNLDEIVYFFEETKFRYVFFEDLDRLENSKVFVHLRELNMLLNNYEVIKKPIVFIYAVKDNIFSDTDRTKFFDFIVPVIPIINSTNSGETLLEKLAISEKKGIKHQISENFVLDVSPFISDMRILQNIYNEFSVYKNILRMGQDLHLEDESMMALIIFKNLYPCDFADIQIENGIIKQAFIGKQDLLKKKQEEIMGEIDKSTKILESIPLEMLKKVKELKCALLCEITGWLGMAREIRLNYHTIISAEEIISDTYNMAELKNASQCSGNYNDWHGNGGYSYSCYDFSKILSEYFKREERIKMIEGECITEEQERVEQLKIQLHNINGWTLKLLIEQFGIEEVLSEEVKKNKFLVFLLRKGYIDEKYTNYINYFKGNSITKDDMNYILAVKNSEISSFHYALVKTPMVIKSLQVSEFEQKAIYNFDVLECLLSSNDHIEKLNAFIKQLADENEQSWKYIDEFIEITKYQDLFINLLTDVWHNMWGYIANNAVLTYERKIYYLSLIISYAKDDNITLMNKNNVMSNFMKQHENILQQLASIESNKLIDAIKVLSVKFSKVAIDKVPDDVLDYIFDNNYYELNAFMIQQIVKYKNNSFVTDLETKNYTTIINLGYENLIKYVRENLSLYIETIVLAEEHSFDSEENIIDLLERSVDDIGQCVKLIEHEEFCIKDIICCCGELIKENKHVVEIIWDTLLKNSKVLSSWDNIIKHWSMFGFTQGLLAFINEHTGQLLNVNSQHISDNYTFIEAFICSDITDNAFEILLPCIKMDNFSIELNSVKESRMSIMIGYKYFNFTLTRYKEIEKAFPDLRVDFILQNQMEYLSVINEIQMDSNLLEALLFNEQIETETAQKLLDIYGTVYMTNRIAENLPAWKISINKEAFNAAWKLLSDSGKQKLILNYMELLDADAMHYCFAELRGEYSNFSDRSRQHIVEITSTLDNQKLVEYLKKIDYITSYRLKEKKEYDVVTESEKVETVITCRIKAIKSQ